MHVDLLRGHIEVSAPHKGHLRRKMSGEEFPQALEPPELVLESGVLPIIPLRHVGVHDRNSPKDPVYQSIPVCWSLIIETGRDLLGLLL